ncbi:Cytoplasmic glyoxalase II [Polyrhizophydium stewartii]|uniref:hydroxyacylglutathione hydrolase n=1 Tax=Polyrhizophydium stewartii TaxID=2732419 RepID=A0ABR4N6U6_9FUNG
MPTRATVLGLLALAAVAAPAAWVLALPRRRRDNVLRTLVFESVLGYAALRMLEPPAGAEPHRRTEREPPLSSGPFEVLVVPSLQDNYAYVVADRDQGTAVIIDPSDAKAIFEVLREHSLRPLAILNTHKHWDHCSGNLRIVAKFPGIDVYGSALDFGALSLNRLFQRTTHFVVDNDVLTIGRFVFRVILAPCHTRGSSHGRNRIPSGDAPQSINMLDLDPARARELSESLVPVPTSLTDWHPFAPSLFTGDTLMTAGCGRFFEAESAYDMHQIAARLIATLPPDTNLFPGHEYSIANLAFARLLEPGNFTLQLKFKQAEDAAWLRTAMVPTTLQEEALYNPFLRLDARGRRGELWRNVMRQAALLRASDSTEPILDVVRRETVAACAAHGLTGSTLDEAIAIGCLRALKDRCRFKDGKAEL